MRILAPFGVFRPRSDTWMLAGALRRPGAVPAGGSVLDLGTGSGALAVAAALGGAGSVTAVDVSRRALAVARLNARRNGVALRTRRGDLFAPVAGERFDAVVSNPPYLPAPRHAQTSRAARAWDAGPDGRAVLDRLIAGAPAHLHPGGALWLIHSNLAGIDATRRACAAAGMIPEVVAEHVGPLGELGRAREAYLRELGVLDGEPAGQERMAIVRATLPAHTAVAVTPPPARRAAPAG